MPAVPTWRRRAMATAAALVLLAALATTGPGTAAASTPAQVLTVAPNTYLGPGRALTSATGQYALTMRADGNLVLLAQGQVLWGSNTAVAGATAIMQGDGNLVIYAAGKGAIWSSGTYGHPGAVAAITAAGNLAIVADAQTLWQSGTVNTALTAGHLLLGGQSLTSANGRYLLIMQTDGNLVLYDGSRPLWSTGTSGHGNAIVSMQTDGNLVLRAGSTVLWTSATARTGATSFSNMGNGQVAVLTAEGVPAFQAPSGTQGARIVAAALASRGTPYCFAGGDQNGPTHGRDAACRLIVGFDCSGLALYSVYRALGVLLPHYSVTQWKDAMKYHGVRPFRSQLLPGDLVFFLGDGTPAAPGHVGIYAGNNLMVDAQQPGVRVALHTLYNGYVGAVRYWH